ncbi:hypothetical protein HHI36_008562 [Cryptolaemus montrouzieri]|uniref:Uncharacterized protein n=1 Tax=Cryptolaemus montrouzieri TaxID=559131 RepID=A0ABD2MSY2_9CUCU
MKFMIKWIVIDQTFTFEQTRDINDPETKKCIEFWKSVMQKNLAPIKCTLLDCNQKCEEKKKKRSSDSSELKHEPKKAMSKTEKNNTVVNGAKIWSQALKEIRRRKLDQLKLYVRERCEYCRDPFTKDLSNQLGVQSLEEQTTEIISLNEWKPKEKQINLVTDFAIPKKRMSVKLKSTSTIQRSESKMKKDSSRKPALKEQATSSKTKIASQEPMKKISSVSKPLSDMGSKPSADYQKRVSHMITAEVQAPQVKCPCGSDTCVCPHKAAERNSRTSFVEIARKSMVAEDKSIEKFFPLFEDTCICAEGNSYPWMTKICSTEPCPGRSQKMKIEESSSNFNLDKILGTDAKYSCICGKTFEVACPNDLCKNRESQGSLVEGFPKKEGDAIEDTCICVTTDAEVPCVTVTCPSKTPRELSTECTCKYSQAWSQSICQSWSCPHSRKKLKKRRKIEEENIKFYEHPKIKDVASTCVCGKSQSWKSVTCFSGVCARKPKRDNSKSKIDNSKPKIENQKLMIETSKFKTENPKFANKNLVVRKTSSLKSLSKENIPKKSSISSREKIMINQEKPQRSDECICSTSPPWRSVICPLPVCKTKMEAVQKNREKAVDSIVTTSKLTSIDTDCICEDKTLEPICKTHKCADRGVPIKYTPPCICPKDEEETTHEHFTCPSDKCKMKKIDKTCICITQPEAPCESKVCKTKAEISKTSKYTKKPLKYDTQCICKVRGLPTTQEVSCTTPECPYTKKLRKMPKRKSPELFVQTNYREVTVPDEGIVKCICGTKDLSISVKCQNLSCRIKNRSQKSDRSGESVDDDNSESEICICNDIGTVDSQHEVICKQVHCQKISFGEGGVAITDKCVCTSMDTSCNEQPCPPWNDIDIIKECAEDLEKEIPYCYICGRHDCVNSKKRSARWGYCTD